MVTNKALRGLTDTALNRTGPLPFKVISLQENERERRELTEKASEKEGGVRQSGK